MAPLITRNVSLAKWSGNIVPLTPTAYAWEARNGTYEGAAGGRRTIGWNPGNESVNAALYAVSDTLRARSRDMVRKNAWANNGSEVFVSEAIGTGIKPQSLHPNAKKKAALQKLWLTWTDECDAHGTQDFYGLQGVAFRSMMEGGECFIRLRQRLPVDKLTVPLQIQLLEAEHCPTNKNELLPNGNTIKQGIEFNLIGKRVAYWLYPVHPGETGAFGLNPDLVPVRVPAEQVLHMFRVARPGQIRGEPWLSRALIRLHDYDQYTDAELTRKKIAALFAGFITENDPADPLPGVITKSLPDSGEWPSAPLGVSFSGLEPGTLQKLNPGEDIKFSNPADVGPGFKDFNISALREIAAAIGLTYEQLSGDLTGVNYSSIRAGLLTFRRKMEQIQHSVVVFQMCRPIWNAWLEAAVFADEISATDYAKNVTDYRSVKWIAPGWTWVDPEKEVRAAVAAVRAGFRSKSQIISENGYDMEDVFQEIAAENKVADDLELIFDSDPRQTSSSGMRPSGRDPSNPDGLQDPEVIPSQQQLASAGSPATPKE